MVNMHMNVDDARGDIVAAHVHDLRRRRGVDVRCHRRNFAAANGNIHTAINVVERVDHVAVLEE